MHCGIPNGYRLGFINIYIYIYSSWICFPRGPEDGLIKVETCRPDNVLFLLFIK